MVAILCVVVAGCCLAPFAALYWYGRKHPVRQEVATVRPDIDAWVDAMKQGRYPSLPLSDGERGSDDVLPSNVVRLRDSR